METSKFPNIEALNKLYIKHHVSVAISKTDFLDHEQLMPKTILQIDDKKFELYLDDEFNNIKLDYPLLNFCIVLRELEDFQFSNNYEIWCKERNIDSSDLKIKSYYHRLDNIYHEIEKLLGSINSYISSFDFEFDMGEAYALRNNNW